MTLVVDASVAMRWFVTIEATEYAERVLSSTERLIAPELIIAEITNGAWKAVSFGSASEEGAREFVRDVARQFDELVPLTVLHDRAFALSHELQHPAYDCFYLALAEQRNCQLVTADSRLLNRCARTKFAKLVRPLVGARRGRSR